LKFFKKRHLALLLIIIPCFTPLLPIRVSYSFDGTGKVYPKQEWVLTRDTEGGLISTLYDHEWGIISEVSSYKFERGDIANIQITPFQASQKRIVLHGDTIARVRSYILEERINALQVQLAVEKARFRSTSAGEKVPVIAEARQRLEFAREQYNLDKLNFERAKGLYQDAVISELEFNEAENTFKLAEIQIKIARSALEAAEMGEKPEEVALIRATIKSIENELAFLLGKREQYTLVSPISGIADYTVVPEQVLAVDDTSKLILTVPVRLNNQRLVKKGTPLEVRVPGLKEKLAGEVIGLNSEVQVLEGTQVLMVKAEVHDELGVVRKGTMVECTFKCEKIRLWAYLNRLISR
jgi:hypothetical protein